MHRYAIALGSNRRTRFGSPAATLRAVPALLAGEGIRVTSLSPILATDPWGPGGRRFANAAALIETEAAPPELLVRLKRVERAAGRRRGRRWGARALDLDILLWSGGRWQDRGLTVPHRGLAERPFVLAPLARIAAGERVPPGGATVRQLAARLQRSRPAAVDPGRRRP